MTELMNVKKSEKRENSSDDSQIKKLENDDEVVYHSPKFRNSEEKAHQSFQAFTSCIVEVSSKTKKFNDNEESAEGNIA